MDELVMDKRMWWEMIACVVFISGCLLVFYWSFEKLLSSFIVVGK